jgi:hypothetical protein
MAWEKFEGGNTGNRMVGRWPEARKRRRGGRALVFRLQAVGRWSITP